MGLIKSYNKERDVTYIYENESYWDKELKQPRSHRKLVGKLDPETGAIIPTGKRGRKKKVTSGDIPSSNDSDTNYQALYNQVLSESETKDAKLVELSKRVASLEMENQSYRDRLDRIRTIVK